MFIYAKAHRREYHSICPFMPPSISVSVTPLVYHLFFKELLACQLPGKTKVRKSDSPSLVEFTV